MYNHIFTTMIGFVTWLPFHTIKLEYYGIRHKALQWISSFLDQRTQCVVCSGHTSLPIDVTSGVPQGTVLGPLLFLIYINDLPDLITSSCSLFADDCLLYREIDTPSDCETLQSDLYKLETWTNEWLMSFNINKCKVIQITLKNPIQSAYYLYGHQLKQVTEAKYLGVTLDSKLNFNKHTDVICKKANTMLSFIRRNLHTQLIHVKSHAYRMYVRPILEYSSAVWAPHTKCSIDKLEAVQRRAARYVMDDYRYNSSVSSMIQSLKWNSLSTRRNISRLIILYKILHQTVDVTLPDYILPYSYSAITRGHNLRLKVPLPRINAYKYSFFTNVVEQWNSLPEHIVRAPSATTFSRLLNTYMDIPN